MNNMGMTDPYKQEAQKDIAVVGMAGIFPGADSLESFWKNIFHCVNSITEVDPDRWRVADMFDPQQRVQDRTYAKWGGFIKDIPFDPTRFGIPPVTLKSVDAMQFLALEVAFRALSDAGLEAGRIPKEKTAVVFGAGGMHDQCMDYITRTMVEHYLMQIHDIPQDVRADVLEGLKKRLPDWTEDAFPGILGNVIAGRVANRLDLKGSNFTVDAACASSLAALDVGIAKLRSGEADAALVGAVDLTDNIMGFMVFAQTLVLSPDGQTRPFDDNANGIVISEGAAAVVLKRMADARRDGDRIHAVIKGIGSASDGRNRSLTAPHHEGQSLALKRAYTDAGVCPETVGLIEAHGTGTTVGDRSEVTALKTVFSGDCPRGMKTALGSVKSNIGHTKIAAGLAGIIKGIMALNHQLLPATLGIKKPNTGIDFSGSAFYLNTENRPWLTSPDRSPRRCGVSSFGFGGTNFHVVLEEYRDDAAPARQFFTRENEIFLFSGKDSDDLCNRLKTMDEMLRHPAHTHAGDLARALYSAAEDGKMPQDHMRLNIVAATVSDLKGKLQKTIQLLSNGQTGFEADGIYCHEQPPVSGKICFLFPGQGAQSVGMLQDLLVSIPELQAVFERADVVLDGWFDGPLSAFVFPEPGFSGEERRLQAEALNDTRLAQPALAAADITMLRLAKRMGLQPDFCAGHSFGEYVALHAAGVISRDDVFRLAALRGKLAAETTGLEDGRQAMAALRADENTVRRMLEKANIPVETAIVNSPLQTVVAGAGGDIDRLLETAAKEGISATRIPVTAAFHTQMMAPAAEGLAKALETVLFSQFRVPVYSNATGKAYPETAHGQKQLLVRHMTAPLNFMSQIIQMYEAGARCFIEVGPGRILSGLVGQVLNGRPHVVLPMDGGRAAGMDHMAHFLARAHAMKLSVNPGFWYDADRRPFKTVETVVAAAAAKQDPPAVMWRISNGRIKPWHEARHSPVIENQHQNTFSNAPSGSAGPENRSAGLPFQKEVKTFTAMNNSNTQIPTARPADGPSDRQDLVGRIQANMEQFLDMQRSQQHLMERFLDMQQQLMDAVLNGSVPGNSGIGWSGKEAAARPPITPMAKPPAPVLPELVGAYAKNGHTPGDEIPTSEGQAPVARPAEPAAAPAAPEDFEANLLRIVSDLTGYPEEMLPFDAHLEADLGIDSIKRVEILSLLEDRYPEMEIQSRSSVLEELAGLDTLKKIVDWYLENAAKPGHVKKNAEDPDPAAAMMPTPADPAGTAMPASMAASGVKRYEVVPKQLSPPVSDPVPPLLFPKKDLILLVGAASPIRTALSDIFSDDQLEVRNIHWETGTTGGADEGHTCSPDADFQQLISSIRTEKERVGAVVCLAGIPADGVVKEEATRETWGLFNLLKVLEPDLKASAREGGGKIIAVTAQGGDFGTNPSVPYHPEAAGVTGLVKTVALEWPGMDTRCIDIDPQIPAKQLALSIKREIAMGKSGSETGISSDGHWTMALEENEAKPCPVKLTSRSVLLLLGGASGITAEIAKQLAAEYSPTLVLVGRTAISDSETDQTRQLSDRPALKSFFIAQAKADDLAMTPAEVDEKIEWLIKQRQLAANIAAMKAAGATVEYHCLDVTDRSKFSDFIKDTYDRFGCIDGVIHGAGITEDRRIKEKDPASFKRVLDTKVIPASVLADTLEPDTLKFFAFFSSISARFGNRGQCDYSAANEVLNKWARQLARKWENTRVVSIGWGPWEMGMVTQDLKRFYTNQGVALISAAQGRDFFMKEIGMKNSAPVEVIVSSGLNY